MQFIVFDSVIILLFFLEEFCYYAITVFNLSKFQPGLGYGDFFLLILRSKIEGHFIYLFIKLIY